MSVVLAKVTDEPIDAEQFEAAVESPVHGAVVTFRGVIRDHDSGNSVASLDYSAHPDAERFLRESCERIAADTDLTIAAVHRIGSLAIGDVALVAVVASAHRREAFEACSRLVDDIKTTVPIWKRQHYANSTSEWVGL